MHIRLFLILQIAIFSLYSTERLEFERNPTEIPSLGMKLNLFENFTAEKREPVKTYYFTLSNKNTAYERTNAESFKVNDIWLQDQLAISYKSPLIDLKIYTPKTLKPKEHLFNKVFITAENYRYHCKQYHIKTLKKENLNLWLKDIAPEIKVNKFLRSKSVTKHRVYKLSHNVKGKELFLLLNKNQNFIFEFKPNVELRNFNSRISSFFSKLTIKASSDSSSSRFTNRGTQKKGERSSEYQATVDSVIAQVRGQKGWWYAETDNYVFKSNLSSKQRRLAQSLQDRIEVMRKKLHKFIPPVNEINEVSVVTIIDTQKNYLEYVKEAPEWSAGVWHPGRREVIVWLNENDDNTIGTLLHETFHQYIFYALDRKSPPVWYNEGHADLVRSSKISKTGYRAEIIEDQYRHGKIKNQLRNRSIDLKRFLYLGYQEFYDNPELNYPIAWSLVYFLQKGHIAFKGKGYEKICPKIYEELKKNSNIKKAVDNAFYGINLSELQKDYYEFWNSTVLRRKAERNKIFNVK